jgi:hypothetical protein
MYEAAGRMHGDDALRSSSALINREYLAKFAGNFAMKRRRGGRGFKSDADNQYRRSGFAELAEVAASVEAAVVENVENQ